MRYLRKFNESKSNTIRVSCASLARIEIGDKYLLLLNKRRAARGEYTYSPIGGGLEFKKDALPFLSTFTEKYEKGNDLRLFINRDSLDAFTKWFKSSKDREVGIDRELVEEFVDEEKFFESLTSSDYESVYVKTGIYPYAEGCRFFEIYNVKLSDEKERYLLDNINNSHFKLFSHEEIINGKSENGDKIGFIIADSSKTII